MYPIAKTVSATSARASNSAPRSVPTRLDRHSPALGQNFMFLKIPSGIARTMAMTAHHLAL